MSESGLKPNVGRGDWSIPDGVIYLNHGSFGPSPRVVQEVCEEWSRQLNANPMDFFLRQFDGALEDAAGRLGQWIGVDSRDLVFVDNATVAMNIVAESLPLGPGDEVLLNDHEYGAVLRIWRAACERTGARVVSPTLGIGDHDAEPRRFEQTEDISGPILEAITPRTKLIVVSHIASPTAVIFPVEKICREARQRGIPVCIDGPHAIAMQPVNLRRIDCDFYCASLHKWLSAPFGSGFLYVRPNWQSKLKPHLTSWGRSLGGHPPRWQDDYNWLGTRDPAPFLSVPAAIDFLERVGPEAFRQQTHVLARYARQRLEPILGQTATIPDSPDWYGSMIAIPLPPGSSKKARRNAIHPLQQALWDLYKIESLVTECHGHRYLRVSCHLYNTAADIDALCDAVRHLSDDERTRIATPS
jgi:isopenicillin-N epimerase